MERRIADEPFSEADARHFDFLAVLQRQLHLELATLLVQQQDAERAIVDDALGQLRDAGEQLVELEHRCDVAADLGERLECFGIARAAIEQPRVDERDRHMRAELPHDRDVVAG